MVDNQSNSSNWSTPPDDRKSGMKYPNFSHEKTPSGHEITYDDTKGSESVTIRHRTGSIIQMQHDGSVVIKNQKHKYEVTFGESKMIVTGSHDITVNGGGSLRVEGNYDVHVNGDHNHTVTGNTNVVVGGNHNSLIAGNKDEGVNGSHTVKYQGNQEITTTGKLFLGGDKGVRIHSTDGDVDVIAEKTLNTYSGNDTNIGSAAKLTAAATGKTTLSSKDETDIISENKTTINSIKKIKIDAPDITSEVDIITDGNPPLSPVSPTKPS